MSESVGFERLHLRHLPVRDWIIGALLLIADVTVTVLLVLNFVRNGADNVQDTVLFFALMILVGLSTWFYESLLLLFSPAVFDMVIDPKERFVELTHYRIYGRRTDRYYFHQIAKIRSQKPKSRRARHYFAELILANKKKIFIRIPIGNDKVEVTNFVKKLNKLFRSNPQPNAAVREWTTGESLV